MCYASCASRIHRTGRKRWITICLFFWCALNATQAQFADPNDDINYEEGVDVNQHGFSRTRNDSTSSASKQKEPRDVKMFHLDTTLGEIIPIETDTAVHRFQNLHLTEGLNGEYNHLGNMGSPRLSRIFFNREPEKQYVFADAMKFFLLRPSTFNFTNTKSPYSNLSYYRAGNKINGEERFKAYFAVNVGKRTGFGFNIDYLCGRGLYDNQSTSFFNGSLYGYHHGEHYSVNVLGGYDQLKWNENGGITDDRYITQPESMAEGKKRYSPADMPVQLNRNWNENKMWNLFVAQNYNIGYYKTRIDSLPDTVMVHHDFVPVTKIFHTLELQDNNRRFIDYTNPKGYYANDFLRYDSIDATHHFTIRNTLGLNLIEGFNKWVPMGVSVYATHEFRRFTLPDSIDGGTGERRRKYNENVVTLGGNIRRTMGKMFHFDVTAETVLAGTDLGAFNVKGKGSLNIPVWKDTLRIGVNGYIRNDNPSFYYRHYHSQHFWWDNNLRKEFRTRIGGEISVDRWGTHLYAGVENIKNYTYLAGTPFNSTEGMGTPMLNDINARQYTGNIQVLSATLNQDLHWGIFHWDNEVTVQYSSKKAALPLPLVNLYSNLYLKFAYAKVLKIELGADMRFFTKYDGPDYAPGLGQFYVRTDNVQKIGGYPFINAYANFHLKQVRFYLMFYHVNQNLFKNTQSFLVPHYPVNPRMFKLGLSWNFWN